MLNHSRIFELDSNSRETGQQTADSSGRTSAIKPEEAQDVTTAISADVHESPAHTIDYPAPASSGLQTTHKDPGHVSG